MLKLMKLQRDQGSNSLKLCGAFNELLYFYIQAIRSLYEYKDCCMFTLILKNIRFLLLNSRFSFLFCFVNAVAR